MLKILLFDLSYIKFSMAFQLSLCLQWKFQLNELQKFCYHEQRKKPARQFEILLINTMCRFQYETCTSHYQFREQIICITL